MFPKLLNKWAFLAVFQGLESAFSRLSKRLIRRALETGFWVALFVIARSPCDEAIQPLVA
ncbi:MAG: hypothetical protein BGN84_10470 [Afipia sp. 62-7]|nr:MAG: hypothetical protein BGN84_10470 [Afipia sp. 62-7]